MLFQKLMSNNKNLYLNRIFIFDRKIVHAAENVRKADLMRSMADGNVSES